MASAGNSKRVVESNGADEQPAAQRQRVGEHVQQAETSGSASAADIIAFIKRFAETHVIYSNQSAILPAAVISKTLQSSAGDIPAL